MRELSDADRALGELAGRGRTVLSSELEGTKTDDRRSMVDCVMIDTDYDGKGFDSVFSDVPEKKADPKAGMYELPVPKKGATIAVKIIDMLSEEVLATGKL